MQMKMQDQKARLLHPSSPKLTDAFRFRFAFTDFILRFCIRIKSLNISFTLYQVDAKELPETLVNHGKILNGFDRIEAG